MSDNYHIDIVRLVLIIQITRQVLELHSIRYEFHKLYTKDIPSCRTMSSRIIKTFALNEPQISFRFCLFFTIVCIR